MTAEIGPRLLHGSYAVLATLAAAALVGPPLARAFLPPDGWLFAWLEGTRGTMAAAALTLSVSFVVGTLGGALAPLGPPAADALLSRAMEIAGALPSVIVAVVVRELSPMPELAAVAVVLAVLRGLSTARVIRARVLQLSTEEFVVAAHALGGGRTRLFRRHLYPHVAGHAAAGATFAAASVVALDAALSFVGLGTSGPSWGGLIAEAATRPSPLLCLAPVVGVLSTVSALHVLSEAAERRRGTGRFFL